MQNGNGWAYILKKNENILFEITDNIKKVHIIFGNKSNVWNKTKGKFDFHELIDFQCYGYSRLYPLNEYWNNGLILSYKSEDKGINRGIPSFVSNFLQYFVQM